MHDDNSCNKYLYTANERKITASNKDKECSSLFNICIRGNGRYIEGPLADWCITERLSWIVICLFCKIIIFCLMYLLNFLVILRILIEKIPISYKENCQCNANLSLINAIEYIKICIAYARAMWDNKFYYKQRNIATKQQTK